MNNKNRYNVARGLKLLWGLLATVLAIFIRRRDLIVLTASHNTSFSDNARAMFLALYELPQYREKVYFVINDRKRMDALNRQYPGRFLANTSLASLCLILSARVWMTSSLEFPAPGFFNRYLRTVYHLGHGMPYKVAGLLEGRVSWLKRWYYRLVTSNISWTWATTPFFRQVIADIYGLPLSRVLLLPQPKTGLLGCLAEDAPALLKNRDFTHVLYAPTWRHYASVQLFPFAGFHFEALREFLEENNIVLWFRFHPKYEQAIDPVWKDTMHIQSLSARQYDEANEYLGYFDGLVTDYSSLYLDYLLLCRPVIFLDYDMENFNREVGLVAGYETLKVGATATDLAAFEAGLLGMKRHQVDSERFAQANRLVNYPLPPEKILGFLIKELFEKLPGS